MTTENREENGETCRVQGLLKLLSGKWKPELFHLATLEPLRFNSLMRKLKGINKQSLATALRELEDAELLEKSVISEKPLHIEYRLTEKGKSLVPVFQQLEKIM